MIERLLGIAVPTREEMQEIEVSSRLYVENGARYMTATLMCQSDTDMPKTTPVTFILADHKLVTVRYDEPRPFTIVTSKLARQCPASVTGETVFLDLFDAVIDRAADILEKVAAEMDMVSHQIFEPTPRRENRSRTYNHIMRTIGRKGDLASKVCNRAARADRRNARGGIHVHMRGHCGNAAQQVEDDEAHMADSILDVVAEDPQEEHVSEKVSPAGMQEHRREHADQVEPHRDHPVDAYELLERRLRQRLFEEKRDTVEDDEGDREEGKCSRRNHVAQRNHPPDCDI